MDNAPPWLNATAVKGIGEARWGKMSLEQQRAHHYSVDDWFRLKAYEGRNERGGEPFEFRATDNTNRPLELRAYQDSEFSWSAWVYRSEYQDFYGEIGGYVHYSQYWPTEEIAKFWARHGADLELAKQAKWRAEWEARHPVR